MLHIVEEDVGIHLLGNLNQMGEEMKKKRKKGREKGKKGKGKEEEN